MPLYRFLYAFAFLAFVTLPLSLSGQFILNGSAIAQGNGCYQLTGETLFQAGSIWNATRINLNESFEVQADIFLGCIDLDGADGMVFGFQPVSTSVGNVGEGMGFQGVVPSLGIEFDTYQNANYADPAADHVAIISDGNVSHFGPTSLAAPVPMLTDSPNIEDCENHLLRVVWDAPSTTLSVFIDCEPRLSYTGDIVNDIFNGNPMVYWGFTSATGGSANIHRICLNYTTFENSLIDTAICRTESIELRTSPGFAEYAWTPSMGLSNPNIFNPIANPQQTTLYTVSITDQCGQVFVDEVLVSVEGEPVAVELGEDQTRCASETVLLDAEQNLPNTQYTWQGPMGTLNSPTLVPNLSGTYSVEVRNGTCVVRDSVEIIIEPVPNLNLGGTLTACEGDTLWLDAGSSAGQFTWQDGSEGQLYPATAPGEYSVFLEISACSDRDTVTVLFAPRPYQFLPDDTLKCEGVPLALLANTYPGASYAWQDGSTSPLFFAPGAGSYHVRVQLGICVESDTVLVSEELQPIAALGPDTVLCINGRVTVNTFAPQNDFYLWEDGFDGPERVLYRPGQYSVAVGNGCNIVFDNIIIDVRDCHVYFAPNAFSPDNDGHNDVFTIFGGDNVSAIKRLEIFDRWGSQVFLQQNLPPNDPNYGWDGWIDGSKAPTGVYVWLAELSFIDGRVELVSGDLMLMR